MITITFEGTYHRAGASDEVEFQYVPGRYFALSSDRPLWHIHGKPNIKLPLTYLRERYHFTDGRTSVGQYMIADYDLYRVIYEYYIVAYGGGQSASYVYNENHISENFYFHLRIDHAYKFMDKACSMGLVYLLYGDSDDGLSEYKRTDRLLGNTDLSIYGADGHATNLYRDLMESAIDGKSRVEIEIRLDVPDTNTNLFIL